MANNMYWISVLVFATVLIFILVTDCLTNKSDSSLVKLFRVLICWVIYFCFQDVFWGLCASHVIKSDRLFFLASTIFHCSTVITTFFWLLYVLKYLGTKVKYAKYYLLADASVILLQFVLLAINYFEPTIFSIVNGDYITHEFRPAVFFNQYIVYLAIGLVALVCAVKGYGTARRLYFSVFLFSFSPILSGFFQLMYPNEPFYSIGYFIGCVVIYLTVVYNETDNSRINSFARPLANIYYSLHLIDLKKNEILQIISSDILDKILRGRKKNYTSVMMDVINATVEPLFIESVISFTDVNTLSERMKNRQIISHEFLGVNYGWMRMSLIVVKRDNNDQIIKFFVGTRVIDREKKYEQKLLQRSNTDKLTGLLNRRAYEEDVEYYSKSSNDQCEFIYLSLDVNGLKVINDNLGHEAGDELITGCVNCIQESFSNIGKVYRVGGDEFIGIIKIDLDNFEKRLSSFNKAISEWKGKLVDSLAVSYGWVRNSEFPQEDFKGIARIADERMYQQKTEYYRELGVDRRGNTTANVALLDLYAKILKINITRDLYYIVKVDTSEKVEDKGFSDTISGWFTGFAKSGMIHSDDISEFLSKTNIDYLRKYFYEGESRLSIYYRRQLPNGITNVVMDLVRADDYTELNQSLFLYVRTLN